MSLLWRETCLVIAFLLAFVVEILRLLLETGMVVLIKKISIFVSSAVIVVLYLKVERTPTLVGNVGYRKKHWWRVHIRMFNILNNMENVYGLPNS